MTFFEKFLGTKEKVRRRAALLEQARDIFFEGRQVSIRRNGRIEKGWSVMETKLSERPPNKGEPIALVDKEDQGLTREEEVPIEELMELNK